jgi:YjbE family integral membrane protein
MEPLLFDTLSHQLLEIFTPEGFSAFLQVVLIDIALAGDNAVVIALAAQGLPTEQRNKAIAVGIGAATVLRVIFAALTVQLLNIVGLLLAGGILLLWVCWKMWRELHPGRGAEVAHPVTGEMQTLPPTPRTKTFRQAAIQIVIADVSMSLDNVLAVAGAAREHPIVLVFGLALSIALMGFAAVMISKLLHRYRWIAYLGLAVILYVALDMISHGGQEVWPYVQGALG